MGNMILLKLINLMLRVINNMALFLILTSFIRPALCDWSEGIFRKLTSPSDGQALCALDTPSLTVAVRPRSECAPRCGIEAGLGGCVAFNEREGLEGNGRVNCDMYSVVPLNYSLVSDFREV